MEAAGAEAVRRLQALLFETCMCFFASFVDPAQRTIAEEWKGPVPPIRQFIAFGGAPPPPRSVWGWVAATRGYHVPAVAGRSGSEGGGGGAESAFVLTSRKAQGVPAIEAAVLQGLCNVTRAGGGSARSSSGVREELCVEVALPIGAGGADVLLNTCDLHWEPRKLEASVASCLEAQVPLRPLSSPPLPAPSPRPAMTGRL